MKITVTLDDLAELQDDYDPDVRQIVRDAVRSVLVKTVKEEMQGVKEQVQEHLKGRFARLLDRMMREVDEMTDDAVMNAMWGKE